MHELKFKGPSPPQPTGEELSDECYARTMSESLCPIARMLGLCPRHGEVLVTNAEGTLDCPECVREDYYEDKP